MSSGVNLLTGHQATNHISAADDAAFASAFSTGDNCVVADAQEITLTTDTSTGTLTVGAFVALFSGRKVVVSGASGTYTQPASGTTYRHVSAGLLYSKDTNNDDVEDCTFVVYTSANDRSTESDAASDDTGAPSTIEIGSATTSAYFELFDLIVSASAVKSQTAVYSVTHSVPYVESLALMARVEEYTGVKSAVTTGEVYYAFDTSAYTLLRSAKFSVIKLWKSNDIDEPAFGIYVNSNNLATSVNSSPVLLTLNGVQTLVVFAIGSSNTGTYAGKLFCRCATINSGQFVISPNDIPYDRASIFVWR